MNYFSTKNIHEITKEYIYSKINSSDILKVCTNHASKNNKYFIRCPYHKDSIDSLAIDLSRGRFKCFGCGESGDGISLYMKLNNLSYYNALKQIYNEFNLDFKQSRILSSSINGAIISNSPADRVRSSTMIDTFIRDWDENLDSYWLSYGISLSVLQIFDVYPLQEYWINRWKAYTFDPKNPSYCFKLGKEREYVKILSPYSTKYKWVSNTPKNIYSGYNQLPNKGDIVIITSSLKDVMVLYTLGYSAISPQAESNDLDEWLVEDLKNRFKYIYLNYDNDSLKERNSGKIFSEKVINKYPFIRNIYVPDEYKQKDISDYSKTYGIDSAQILIDSLL